MVLLSDGKVVATGKASDIMGRLDLFPMAARYEPGTLLETRVIAHDDTYALTTLRSAAGELRVPRIDVSVGASLRLRIRARDVTLALKPPEGLSALNVFSGQIVEIDSLEGPFAEVRIDLKGEVLVARVTRLTLDRLGLVPGKPVFAIIKTVAIDRQSLGQFRSVPEHLNVDEITL
jgi:molybdate transport system ATP-binding protein